MAFCFSIDCQGNQNEEDQIFCSGCGASVVLKDRYRATQLLGSGGFGRTFAGIDQGTDLDKSQPCAVKQLHIPGMVGESREKIIELFERESQWLYQLDEHPQTPRFIDYFAEGDRLYLIQELIIGQTLTQEMNARTSPYQEVEVVEFLQEVVAILRYIHQYKIIHRDLKPDNFIRRDRDQKWVLIDFGASRILSETALIGNATIIGTPEFMAPEQHRGQAFPASDLYSLGVIAVQLITGRSTLAMFDFQSDQWLWTKFIPSEANLSKSFVQLLNDLIAPKVGDRPKSATTVAQYIQRMERRRSLGHLQPFRSTLTPAQAKATYVNPGDQPTIASEPSPQAPVPLAVTPEPAPQLPEPKWDLRRLNSLLRSRRWQAADTETWNLILQSIHKNPRLFIFPKDIPQIPCSLLRAIDQLWREHSNNQFGFSAQLEIYESVNGEYHSFCHHLGWPLVARDRQVEKDFQFKTRAPLGHLPSRQKMGGSALWRNLKVFYEHLSQPETPQKSSHNF